MTLSNESLQNYYRTNSQLMIIYKFSLAELESMIPFEREIYLALLIQHLQEEKERMEELRKQ